jgi:hypothetical protein
MIDKVQAEINLRREYRRFKRNCKTSRLFFCARFFCGTARGWCLVFVRHRKEPLLERGPYPKREKRSVFIALSPLGESRYLKEIRRG